MVTDRQDLDGSLFDTFNTSVANLLEVYNLNIETYLAGK